ncbi:hypothetical protein C8F04DRAFT_1064715 [Mycena alexandri]|uniref:Transmembrane protein n=1 Tax=Mycena alexandri TaxID=1745969 RepID=A0AAD6TKA6_9AGAR|nr:hypothetical protein C8F04DRAFT_1064715 [Mycena alexandri]
MSSGRSHHTKNMIRAQSSSNDLQRTPKPQPGSPPQDLVADSQHRAAGVPLSMDTITTLDYEFDSLATTVLRASQVTLQPESTGAPISSPTSSSSHMSDRELAFIITAAIFGAGVLLLVAGIMYMLRRRGRGRLTTSPPGADAQEQGLGVPRDFDDSTWGTPRIDDKRHRFQECLAHSPCVPTPSSLTPRLSHPSVLLDEPPVLLDETPVLLDEIPTPSTEFTSILEQFEQRLYQEEKDIALALDIAFGDDKRHCAPFFAGSEDDVTTMLSLQAGMESVGKRAGGIRNRARQGSDASSSSQSTTVTVEPFSSHSSSASSLTSLESMVSDIDESAEEAEEDVVYEVKRAQTHSMEIQKGKLITWQPGGLRLMVTGPSTTTLGTLSSVSVDLDDFPSPPIDELPIST